MPASTHLRFSRVNAAFWVAFIALNLFLGATFGGNYSGMQLISVVLGGSLWVASVSIRRLALTRGWFEQDGLALAWRMAVSVLLAAAVTQALIAICLLTALKLGWVQLPGKGADYRPATAFAYWLNTVIALGAWAALWTGWRAMRRARESEIARLRVEARRRELELDALRARLNPHFVFNALNNLRALINEDTERARELVTRLSNTLRHALEHHTHGPVRLAEELAVVDDYLAVETVHYEARLHVTRDIGADAHDATLPPMLLQLLVENAIKHGIARTAGGGTLSIAARRHAGALHLDVCNPGGLEIARPQVEVPAGERRGGVGLAYLRAQLAGLEPPGTFVLSAQEGIVRAHLEIPQ